MLNRCRIAKHGKKLDIVCNDLSTFNQRCAFSSKKKGNNLRDSQWSIYAVKKPEYEMNLGSYTMIAQFTVKWLTLPYSLKDLYLYAEIETNFIFNHFTLKQGDKVTQTQCVTGCDRISRLLVDFV